MISDIPSKQVSDVPICAHILNTDLQASKVIMLDFVQPLQDVALH